MTRRELFAISPGLLLLNCSSETPKRTPEKPPEQVTGLQALYRMRTFATTWAQDLKVIRLSSMNVTEVKAVPGKAAAWQAQFSSATLGQARVYTFSDYDESATLRKGIFADSPAPLPPAIRPFELGELMTDSDKAWDISIAHGQKYAAAHPDLPVSCILEGDHQTGAPVWQIMWGLSAARSEFSVLVDARAGTYIRTLF